MFHKNIEFSVRLNCGTKMVTKPFPNGWKEKPSDLILTYRKTFKEAFKRYFKSFTFNFHNFSHSFMLMANYYNIFFTWIQTLSFHSHFDIWSFRFWGRWVEWTIKKKPLYIQSSWSWTSYFTRTYKQTSLQYIWLSRPVHRYWSKPMIVWVSSYSKPKKINFWHYN